ncbi:MAG: helicase C-terminal domain-containing protein [Candidatus Cloacimonetes bacterium]|nr:helicase C-terminal domain-containing protein [Candidatus Cloacimonadota bacterium]
MSLSKALEFVALDIETTGLNNERDEIIEIAAVRYRNGEVVERFDSFVRPLGKVPKFIHFLTNISAQDLKHAPLINEVLEDFVRFVGSSTLVGHNLPFDMGFINYKLAEYKGFPLSNPQWDTVELARIYLPFTEDHKLGTLTRYFDISLENAHRADADAEATGQLLLKLADHITENYTMIVNSRILSLSKMAQLGISAFIQKVLDFQRATAISAPPLSRLKSPFYNVIENLQIRTQAPEIEQVFGEGGLFAQGFQGFELRSGQVQMAQEVQKAFSNAQHLIVEAGTGVGKSFAYLVPALEFSSRNGDKVVVSTNTKNLQEQLFYKDLPQLKELLPIPFKAVLVKGRENYICERRWEDASSQRELSPFEAYALLHLYIWKLHTITGDVSENSSFNRAQNSITWRKVCSDRYLCGNRKCPYYKRCYVMNLRREIEDASVVVANHALLLADLRMENSTLGGYSYLVVDEAHNLMASASKHLGYSISYADIIILLNQLSSASKTQKNDYCHQLSRAIEKSVLTDGKKQQTLMQINHLQQTIDQARPHILDFFNLLAAQCSAADSYNKLRIKAKEEAADAFKLFDGIILDFKEILKAVSALNNIVNTFESQQVPGYDTLVESLAAFEQRLGEMEEPLLAMQEPDWENYAMWIENNPKPDRNSPASILNYAPVEVNSFLSKMLYEQVPSIVFTSATLALRGSFRYFLGQSGLNLQKEEKVVQCIVDSPFDYDQQSKLLIGSFLPEPKDRLFQNQALSCLKQIFSLVDVGTMALFTAYRDLDAAYDFVSDDLYQNQRPLFAQGKGGSRTSILEQFKRAKNAVLLGTSSFWEGVDVQGESLSLLILYKIPFQVPSEPLVEAYIDKLERENKDSFMHYMLPNALLKVRQGFGRLIRSKSDRGIVLILDSRVSRKKYGEFFKQILPGKHQELRSELDLINEITRFFAK